jgi:hypothetical protein
MVKELENTNPRLKAMGFFLHVKLGALQALEFFFLCKTKGA